MFAAITHELVEDFYFVFYSERLDMMWILSSEEFIKECSTNKNENDEIIDYNIIISEDISATEDEPFSESIESPYVEYNSYIFVWTCEDF